MTPAQRQLVELLARIAYRRLRRERLGESEGSATAPENGKKPRSRRSTAKARGAT